MHRSKYLLCVDLEIFGQRAKLFNFQVIFALLGTKNKDLRDIFFEALLHDQVIKNELDQGFHRRDIVVKNHCVKVVLNVGLSNELQLRVQLCILHWRSLMEMTLFVKVWVVPSILKLIFGEFRRLQKCFMQELSRLLPWKMIETVWQ